MTICLTAKMTTEPTEVLSRLVLLGTIHSDPAGFAKLTRFLNDFQPDLVLLEMSPFARVFRKRHQSAFQRVLHRNIRDAALRSGVSLKDALEHPEIMRIRRQISYPFEYRAASAFGRRHPLRLVLVDYSPFSRKWISSWPELMSADNIETLLSLPARKYSAQQAYREALHHIQGRLPSAAFEFHENIRDASPLWTAREYFMARQIRTALHVLEPDRPLYVGGWWHLTQRDSIATLRDLLLVEPFRCRLLDR